MPIRNMSDRKIASGIDINMRMITTWKRNRGIKRKTGEKKKLKKKSTMNQNTKKIPKKQL